MYLLLRDNKQSGPYSLDELKTKGLKAYDLVWVEGRSAAWRYPSEIEELRSFAPAVEEQPFDRFYKKPAGGGVGATTASGVGTTTASGVGATMASGVGAAATGQGGAATAVTVTQSVPSSYPATTKRTIYVTMPGSIAAREAAPVRETAPVREAPVAREVMREAAPVRETPVAREAMRETAPAREVPPAREVLRETAPVRDAAVAREVPPFRQMVRKQPKAWIPAAMIGGVLLLFAGGIFIGVSIQKNSSGALKLASKDQQPVQAVTQQASELPSKRTTAVTDSVKHMQTTALALATDVPVVKKLRVTGSKQKPVASRLQAVVPATVADSPGVQATDQHREAIHHTDVLPAADNHESARLALANQVSVGANKYQVGTFGGIRNLQVTVTNRSAYSLDLVVVAVSYIQANKKTYKTENLYFRSIAPGSALMLEAPKSSRGIHVEYKITTINSKELGLSEPGT